MNRIKLPALVVALVALVVGVVISVAATASAQNVAASTKAPSVRSTITGWDQAPSVSKAKQPSAAKTITGWKLPKVGHKTSRGDDCPQGGLFCQTVCRNVGADGKVCAQLAVTLDNDGTGGTLYAVTETIGGGFWETNAVDCSNIRVWNDDSEVKWRKDGNACDVAKNPGYRQWNPGTPMHLTHVIYLGWTGNANLDKEADQDFHVPVSITT